MHTKRMSVAAMILSVGLATTAWAQAGAEKTPMALSNDPVPAKAVEGPSVDPAAKELIDRCRSAIAKVTDLSVTTHLKTTNGTETSETRGSGIATFKRGPNGSAQNVLFRIEVLDDSGKPKFSHAFNGKDAQRIDHDGKKFAELSVKDAMVFPVDAASSVMPMWVYGDVLRDAKAKIVAAKLLPDAEMDKVACRVVQYTVEVPMANEDGEPSDRAMVLTQTRHIGAQDLLPRKLESRITYRGQFDEPMSERGTLGVWTNVKANTQPSESAFTLAAPAGYETVKGNPGSLGIPSQEKPELSFKAGDAAPAFALKTPDGSEVSLASLKGKVVLLDFWATWCGPCKAAMPSIQRLHEKFHDKGVAVFGVNTWERGGSKLAIAYMEKNKYTYGQLLSGDNLAKTYGISGIPTFVLIDAQGQIAHIGVGFSQGEEAHLSEKIAALIEKK